MLFSTLSTALRVHPLRNSLVVLRKIERKGNCQKNLAEADSIPTLVQTVGVVFHANLYIGIGKGKPKHTVRPDILYGKP